MQAADNNRAGFSLIEAMIVLALLAIAATMGFSYMLAARPHAQLERAEITLSAFLGQTRNLAISGEVAARVVFNMDTGEYWSQTLDRNTGNWSDESAVQTLPEGVTFTAGGNTFPGTTVTYTPRGTLMTGGSIDIENSRGEIQTLTGNIATGRFQLEGGNLR